MQILLVDDEVELTDSLSRVLIREGYGVDVAYEGVAGMALVSQGNYQLLILDWMLPGQSGLKICQQMRSQCNQTPVLFLTAKDTLDDRVLGLDAGGDDYLVKPFELRELLARVRALLRRATAISTSGSQLLRFADLQLDWENQVGDRNGRLIELSEKECQLLAYLMRYPNQLLTHEQLYRQLWSGSEPPNSNVLAAQIRLLRRKLEHPGETRLIHTVYGKGYRFG